MEETLPSASHMGDIWDNQIGSAWAILSSTIGTRTKLG